MTWAEALEAWPGAVWLQRSYVAYLVVNALHVLGLGLLVGAILPLDLRLLGAFRAPLAVLAPVLTRAAAAGLGLALATGLWLFSVKPGAYLANPAFLWKLGLLSLALANVAAQHAGAGWRTALAGGGVTPRVRAHAALSALLWPGVLLAGRWIGFL